MASDAKSIKNAILHSNDFLNKNAIGVSIVTITSPTIAEGRAINRIGDADSESIAHISATAFSANTATARHSEIIGTILFMRIV